MEILEFQQFKQFFLQGRTHAYDEWENINSCVRMSKRSFKPGEGFCEVPNLLLWTKQMKLGTGSISLYSSLS